MSLNVTSGANIDPIKAIENYYSTLDEKGKAAFEKETGISGLGSINLMDPAAAEKFCKSHHINLGSNSIWSNNLYDQGKANYADALAQYNEADEMYNDLKAQQDKAKVKYNNLVNNYVEENGEDTQISSGTEAQLRNQSGYTTELIKNTSDADKAVWNTLLARRDAVDMQRHGLMYGA